MLFIQKYYSLKDIEDEFQEPLQKLLAQDVPGLDWLCRQERNLPTETITNYFLFFCTGHNRPVGLAQVNLDPFPMGPLLTWSERLKGKMQRQKSSWKILSHEIKGLIGQGSIFHPHYQKEGEATMAKVLAVLHQDYDVAIDVLNYDDETLDPAVPVSGPYSFSRTIPWVLHKKFKDYRSYLGSLDEKTRKSCASIWKASCQSFDTISGALEQVPAGAIAQEKIDLLRSGMDQLRGEYHVLSDHEGLLALVMLVEGQAGNLFAFFCHSDRRARVRGPEQFAIGLFFEREECQKLHFLLPPHLTGRSAHLDFLDSLASLGLASKKKWTRIFPRVAVVEKNWPGIMSAHLGRWMASTSTAPSAVSP